MRVRELLDAINSFAPFALCKDWDNSGLLLGSPDTEITGVAVCLDAVHDAVIQAHERGCNVLLSHHPLIFRAIKRINPDNEQGCTIYDAVKRGVSIIAAHTNWDKAPEGVNYQLAKSLDLREITPLDDFGVTGLLSDSMTSREFLEHVKRVWNLSRLDYYEAGNVKVSRVSLCGGSGSEFWRSAKSSGSDVYITADMKYHELIDATRDGLNVLLPEHGEMERVSLPALANKVSELGIKVILLDVKALTLPLRI
ncbi:MAG: Nif3-like dinuclear metal center hexameric protein [Synergistaceae bacterium]|nr:Nif3-like dinuclear metal center hexameric protein [Synergistaceae bacterium]